LPMIVTEHGFVEVFITPAMLARARIKARAMPVLHNSIRRGSGNLAGCLGEEVVLSAWQGAATSENTYNHDIRFSDDSGAATFEVKTKDRTVPPQLHYDASVADFNTRQSADFYVFTSLLRNKDTGQYTKGWVMGIIPKRDYFQTARFLREGEWDPTNDWHCKADCYNQPYKILTR